MTRLDACFALYGFLQVSWIYSQDPTLQQYRQALYRVAWGAVSFVERMATSRAEGAEATVSNSSSSRRQIERKQCTPNLHGRTHNYIRRYCSCYKQWVAAGIQPSRLSKIFLPLLLLLALSRCRYAAWLTAATAVRSRTA